MVRSEAVTALAALAQETRLDILQLLVTAGSEGLNAGDIACRVQMPPNGLSFHLDRLQRAGLVGSRRRGRSIIYAARFDAIDLLVSYLTTNCCNDEGTTSAHFIGNQHLPCSSSDPDEMRRPARGGHA